MGDVIDDKAEIFCIQLHMRRTTHEDAYVGIPVVTEIMDLEPDGTGHINVERMWDVARHLSQSPEVDWKVESIAVDPHPVQGGKPDDRTVFDVHSV